MPRALRLRHPPRRAPQALARRGEHLAEPELELATRRGGEGRDGGRPAAPRRLHAARAARDGARRGQARRRPHAAPLPPLRQAPPAAAAGGGRENQAPVLHTEACGRGGSSLLQAVSRFMSS